MTDDPEDLAEAQRRLAADPRPNEALVELARSLWDSDDSGEDIQALSIVAARGGRTELHLAMGLSVGASALDREMGAFVLGRLGNAVEPAYLDETVERLIDLTYDANVSVATAAVYGLGQRTADSALERLEELATHEDPDMRESVAHTLGMLTTEAAVPTLVRLMCDPETRVRDWATFALGTLHEDVDAPEIRDALFARVQDDDAETRGEALVGLARRGDSRAVEMIREDVRGGGEVFGDWAFQAAELTQDRSLLPDLENAWARSAAERHPHLSNALADAIASLKGGV